MRVRSPPWLMASSSSLTLCLTEMRSAETELLSSYADYATRKRCNCAGRLIVEGNRGDGSDDGSTLEASLARVGLSVDFQAGTLTCSICGGSI
jgi:hypothetical protein